MLKRRWLASGAALLFYTALAFLLFWQVWSAPGRRSLGSSSDPEQMMWFLGWTRFALSHRYNPLFSDFLDYPHGVNLMWNASTLLPGALLSPVTAWLGPVVAYNLLLTLSLPLSAWCAYLAIGHWVTSRIAAVVGGLVYGFSPYMLAQALAHPQMTLAFAPPLVLLLLHSLWAQHGAATLTGLALGALAAVQLLTGEEILATSAVITLKGCLLVLGLRLDRVDARQVRHVGGGLGVAAATFLLLGAVPLATQFLGPQQVAGALHPHSIFAADLLNLVVPSRVQLVAPLAAIHVSTHFLAYVEEQNAYLGLPLLTLLVSIAVRWRAHLVVRWASLLAAITVVLSLGAQLEVGGHVLAVALPWHAVEHLPLLKDILPGRLMLYVYLLAGVVLAFYLDQRRRPRARPLVAYTLVALALAPLIPQPPHPLTHDVVPAFFSGDGVHHIPAGSVALIAPFVPYHNPYHDGPYTRPMLWQSMAGMRFRMPEGYAFVPHSSSGTALSPPASALQTVMVAVQEGQAAPAMTSRLRHQLLDNLSAWHVRTVIIGPMGNHKAMRLLFVRLLDHPTVWSGGVDVWWHADQMVEVADQPGGKNAVSLADLHARREQIAATVTEAAHGPHRPTPWSTFHKAEWVPRSCVRWPGLGDQAYAVHGPSSSMSANATRARVHPPVRSRRFDAKSADGARSGERACCGAQPVRREGMDEETLRRIDEVLADFDGKETDISSAGRENTRTVNRVARITPLRRLSGETTFRRNVSRYHVEGAPRDLLIGAERAGGGVWRLIARWSEDEAGDKT